MIGRGPAVSRTQGCVTGTAPCVTQSGFVSFHPATDSGQQSGVIQDVTQAAECHNARYRTTTSSLRAPGASVGNPTVCHAQTVVLTPLGERMSPPA